VPGTGAARARRGYWVVDRDGWIHERGGAPVLCEHLSFQTGYDVGVIAGAAATPTGEGLWALGADGHVWAVGDASRLGDVAGEGTVATGIAATPSGRGYVIALHDGGVRPYGDAPRCAALVTPRRRAGAASGIALSRDRRGYVNGYWVATDDGGVLTFGAAPFLGRSGRRASPVTGIVADPSGRRYAWVHADGSIGRSW
jgi:hypothetical protein